MVEDCPVPLIDDPIQASLQNQPELQSFYQSVPHWNSDQPNQGSAVGSDHVRSSLGSDNWEAEIDAAQWGSGASVANQVQTPNFGSKVMPNPGHQLPGALPGSSFVPELGLPAYPSVVGTRYGNAPQYCFPSYSQRYNPLAQSYPPPHLAMPAPMNLSNSASSYTPRHNSNPFVEEYAPDFSTRDSYYVYGIPGGMERTLPVDMQWQNNLMAAQFSDYMSSRASTPRSCCNLNSACSRLSSPAMVQQSGDQHHHSCASAPYLYTNPLHQDAPHFSNPCPSPSNSHKDIASSKPKKLLWLSEEEAEIIRLIRSSQMKSSSEFVTNNQYSPLPSCRAVPEVHGEMGCFDGKAASGTPSRCSNLSSCSAEEFGLPVTDEPAQMKEADLNWGNSRAQWNSPRKMQEDKLTKQVLSARRDHAATCIQNYWRNYISKSMELVEGGGQEDIRSSDIAATLPDRIGGEQYLLLKNAAIVIQRFWRCFLNKRKQEEASKSSLPTDPKEFYDMIKKRHIAKGFSPPSYEKFLKLLERIHAVTNGARIRRRMKSRRLQTIIKEIKEIRALLQDMRHESTREASTFLPRLVAQLKQKLTQMHTALSGPGDTARFLLRRTPATPLVMCTSDMPSSNSDAREEKSEPAVQSSPSIIKVPLSEDVHERKNENQQMICLRRPRGSNMHDTQKNNQLRILRIVRNETTVLDNPGIEKKKLHRQSLVESDASITSGEFSSTNTMNQVGSYQLNSNRKDPPTDGTTADESMDLMASAKPKRPFLRRKSIAMAPQKLDWSKVKPMVSSRLEPELKTKLFKGRLKEAMKNAALKKTNYSNVQSRLFSYEKPASGDSDPLSDTKMAHDHNIQRPDIVYSEECKKARIRLPDLETDTKLSNQQQSPAVFTEGKKKSSIQPRQRYSRYEEGEIELPSSYIEDKKLSSDRYAPSEFLPMQLPKHDEKKPREDSINQALSASAHLESSFKTIMSLKHERRMTVNDLFVPSKEKTTIPRIFSDSSIFQSSFAEKRKLHEFLIQEGRASRLQHDCLAFISTRD